MAVGAAGRADRRSQRRSRAREDVLQRLQADRWRAGTARDAAGDAGDRCDYEVHRCEAERAGGRCGVQETGAVTQCFSAYELSNRPSTLRANSAGLRESASVWLPPGTSQYATRPPAARTIR